MAGPPVEVQVRVNTGGSVAGSVSNWKVISPGIVTWPVGDEVKTITQMRQDPNTYWRLLAYTFHCLPVLLLLG